VRDHAGQGATGEVAHGEEERKKENRVKNKKDKRKENDSLTGGSHLQFSFGYSKYV
jgi:hypothetical protein